MRKMTRLKLAALVMVASLITACTSSPSQSTVIRSIFELPAGHSGFSNMLVISVAGDYESRALFETLLAANLADEQNQVTAFFTIAGRRSQLTRSALETAILSRGFDTVLLTRQKGQEQADLVVNRPVGQAFDLFGYDYPELNYATSIERAPAITFVTEIYSTADNRKIWSIDTLSFDKATATDLVDEQAATIANQVRQDRILAR